MDLSERIEYIRNNNAIKPGISENEFAKSVGTYAAKFAEIRSGKVNSLSIDVALEISKKYGFDFKWILTGEGQKYLVQKENEELDCVDIPVRDHVNASMGCGVAVYNEDATAVYSVSKKFIKDIGGAQRTLEMIFAQGNSMYPTIESGDSLIIDTSRKDIYDGKIYCVRIEGQLYAKRLQKIPPKLVNVISDNSQYDSFKIDFSKTIDFDFEVIGEVRWWGRVAR